MQKMSKYERKLVNKGQAQARAKARESGRATRMVAIPAAIAVAKLEAMGQEAGVIPSFEIPMLGATRLTTLAGWGLAGVYMFSKHPSTIVTAAGLTGVALAARAQ